MLMNEVKVIERYIILLLGAVADRPIPSSTHLQKEVFVLTKANPKMERIINFEKHYFGPYSEDIDDIANNPVYHPDAFIRDISNRYILTENGKQVYNEILQDIKERPGIKEFLPMIKMVRDLYDRLSTDELLFLIYTTYPDYTEKSKKSDEILSPPKRGLLAKRLFEKGIITEKKYHEIMEA